MGEHAGVQSQLNKGRLELLDLSARNRLLNVPRRSKHAKTIEIADEKSAEIHRLLVREGKSLSFLPALDRKREMDGDENDRDDDGEFGELPQPDDDEVDERGVARRHSDLRLQTLLTTEKLQKRLLSLYYDAQTFREEQGVNVLYLALGMLRWYEAPSSDVERQAPLLLIPVTLERKSAADRFRLRWDQEDPAGNLSLQAKLKSEFGLIIPLPEDEEELDLPGYFAAVQSAVASQPRWEVLGDDMVLGFFSFSKFLMYRDLDPANWPEGRRLDGHPLISALLQDGFEAGESLGIGEDDHIDDHISPARMVHVVDADSSQTLAIEQALGGSMVIQGPPGTGKSQTITNIIAAAVARGEKVLFVAEKMAALDVVKRRLETIGLGAMCLELHSHKMTKTAVLADLKRTSELGRPALGENPHLIERLETLRDRLNRHSARLNTRFMPCALTPFEVIGQLVGLQQNGRAPSSRPLTGAENWTPQQFQERERLLTDIAERIKDEGLPCRHPWRGVRLAVVLRMDLDRLMPRIQETAEEIERLRVNLDRLARLIGQPVTQTLDATGAVVALARVLATAPPIPAELLAMPGWEEHRDEFDSLIEAGVAHGAAAAKVAGRVNDRAWTVDVSDATSALLTHGRIWLRAMNKEYRRLRPKVGTAATEIERLRTDLVRLASLIEQPEPTTLEAASALIAVARVLAQAPQAHASLFTSTAWITDRSEIDTLIELGVAHGVAVGNLTRTVNDKAWDADVVAAHQALLSHGRSWLRIFKGEYRRATALLNAIVVEAAPKSLPGRLGLLDRVRSVQKMAAAIADREPFGREALGRIWQGPDTDWRGLIAMRDWLDLLAREGHEPGLRLIAAQLSDRHEARRELDRLIKAVDTAIPAAHDQVTAVISALNLDLDAAFGTPALGAVNLAVLGARLTDWRTRPHDLRRWIDRGTRLDQVVTTGLDAAVALQNSLISGPRPKSLAARLGLFQRLGKAQRLARALADQDPFARPALGPFWQGTKTEWPLLITVRDWLDGVRRNGWNSRALRLIAARLDDRAEPNRLADAINTEAQGVQEKIAALAAALVLDPVEAVGQSGFDTIGLAELAGRLAEWQARPDDLSRWISLRVRLEEATDRGLGAFVDGLRSGDLGVDGAVPDFRFAYFETLLRMMAGCEPDIAAFQGEEHDKVIEAFRTLDRQRIELARLEVANAHHRGLPRTDGGIGPLGVLRGEFARKRGHMPIRKLVRAAAPAIQALKPVFMMSPLSVAQFLEPGAISFDLLLIDEASQVMPIDALGAVARCRRMAVVGDDRQLPPSRFFAKVMSESLSDDEDEDSSGLSAGDVESILGLCVAKGLSQRMLRWHYRSRHQSLIAVSNREFYDNRLFIVPSPYTAEAGMGLRFHHLRDGVYGRGNTQTNAIEAKAVAEAVIAHARATPARSLGVATFSMKQKQAILDELELLRRQHPDTEEFFQPGGAEPFFVKNLENIQGDERDVIMISVGYGRDKSGYMAMNFGPLSSEGGERRLNVLISRAKHRCEVFASITDEDIDLERGRSRGVAALKVFLQFARTGRLEVPWGTGRGFDSVFEEQVAEAIRRKGYDVRSQIGLAGFFIDLAVADPERPGRYVLGIECDGATYHSARSARDRDRLRQEVLEDHGWIIHRIWSTDWFQRPKEQLRRAVAAIEAAKIELANRQEGHVERSRAVPLEIVTLDREYVEEGGDTIVPLSEPYRQATAPVPVHQQPHEVPSRVMAKIVQHIVEAEGPIHASEIVQRVRGLWGLQRAGNRIQAAVQTGLRIAAIEGRWQSEDQCWAVPGAAVSVRDRSEAESPTLRKPDTLPPQEIREAIRRLVTAHYGGTLDQLTTGAARLFGFKATSAQLKTVIEAQIDGMIQAGELRDSGGTITFIRERAQAE